MTRKTLGELEEQLLLVLLHQGGDSYAVPLVQELEERTGRRVSPTGAYMILRRLEARGYVESRLQQGGEERAGRPRRWFRLRDEVLPLLRKSRAALLTLWDGLEPYLEEQ